MKISMVEFSRFFDHSMPEQFAYDDWCAALHSPSRARHDSGFHKECDMHRSCERCWTQMVEAPPGYVDDIFAPPEMAIDELFQ